MNQDQNNLNQNNFNIQGNNGIPNPQPLNNQSFSNTFNTNVGQNASVNQPTFNVNSFESINTNNQSFNSKPPKKFNLGLILGIIVAVVIVVVGIVIGSKLLSNSSDGNNEGNKNNDNNISNDNNINANINNTKYASYTADYPKEDRTIDYYWNINTAAFDKNKFDGKISFYGNLIESKLTGKTLLENGYSLTNISNGAKDLFNIFDESDRDYVLVGALLQKQDKIYPVDGYGAPKIINYDKNDNFYSDNVELYAEYHYTNSYADFVTESEESNIVFPYFNGIKYDDLTIDIIIENMGVPTYVENREDTVENSNTLLFSYVYVYDDYVFKFGFTNARSVKQTSVEYMGIKTFNHIYRDYLVGDTYNTYTFKSKLEEQQAKYLNAINKK